MGQIEMLQRGPYQDAWTTVLPTQIENRKNTLQYRFFTIPFEDIDLVFHTIDTHKENKNE